MAYDNDSDGPVTVSDRVYYTLRDQIVHGELVPGTRLVQRQTAAQMNTSAIPVLEAIRRLERDGLLVTHSKWGAQVNTWTIEEAEAAYLMRADLEGVAARLFVERATDADKVELVERNRYFEEMCFTRDMKVAVQADIDYHLFVVRCTKSTNLLHMADRSCVITAAVESGLAVTGKRSIVNPEDYVGNHSGHIEGLLSGDPKYAERMARENVLHGLNHVMTIASKK
jgi:DNA-binding GntR family transcriptional regulator